jgi:DNA repair protein RecN (Recombination protein N)
MSAVLAELSAVDANLKPVADNTRDATIALEEVAFDLSRYLDKLDLDPGELAEVNDRLNAINRVLNKYGGTLDATLAYRREIGGKVSTLERATDDLSTIEAELPPLRRELERLAKELSFKRQSVSKDLAPRVERQLNELGMEKAKFTVAFSPACGTIDGEDLPATPSGFDVVEFIAQTNPGQLAQPLRKIASGGELSRIMLALKGILAQSDRISVLVFDEIDANVGGRLGGVIGGKLRELARHHQVLCITHLPQIASYADRHLTVRKRVTAGDRTETSVRVMDVPERLEELAEMIGGTRITDTTRAQAKELLDAAKAQPPRGKRTSPDAASASTSGVTAPPARTTRRANPG